MSHEASRQSPLSILLAEDNIVNQRVASAMLTTLGHKVTLCNNGREAVDALVAGDFDVILMDINMPVLDGLAATREIRALPDPAKAGVTIVAISANMRDDDLAQCATSGITDILGKPLRAEKLRGLLERRQTPVMTAPPSDALLDQVQIAALRDALPPEKLVELFGVARDSLLASAETLREGWRQNDIARIKSAAHRLCGVARNFGCLALGQCAARIEDAAAAGRDAGNEQESFESLLSASLAAFPSAP